MSAPSETFDRTATTSPPALLWPARRRSLGTLALAAGMLVFAAILQVDHPRAGVLLALPGLVMLAVGLGLVGVWGLVDPASSEPLIRLAPTAKGRRDRARALARAVVAPGSTHLPFSGGRVLSVTDEWVVVHGGELVLIPRADLLLVHPRMTSKVRQAGQVEHFHHLLIRARGQRVELDVKQREVADLVALLEQACPPVATRNGPELDRLGDDALGAQVEARGSRPAPPADGPLIEPPPPSLVRFAVGLAVAVTALMGAMVGGFVNLVLFG